MGEIIFNVIAIFCITMEIGRFLMWLTGNDGIYCHDCSKKLSKNRLKII